MTWMSLLKGEVSGLDRNVGGTALQVPQGLHRDAALPRHTGMDPKGHRVCSAPLMGITLPVFSQIPQAPDGWV